MVLLVVLANVSSAARELDARALDGFLGLRQPALHLLRFDLIQLGDPLAVGLLGTLLAVVAILRGQLETAGGVVLLLIASTVSAEVLQSLAYPRFHGAIPNVLVNASFPSGHATAAMALAIGGLMVAPAAARPVAAVVGSALPLGVGISLIVTGSHWPGDVAAGFILTSGWGMAIAAGLSWAREHRSDARIQGPVSEPGRSVGWAGSERPVAAASAGALLFLLAIAAAAASRGDLQELLTDHKAAVLAGAVLATLPLALLIAVMVGLNRSQ